MELFRIKKDIPFMSYARITTVISLVTVILAVAALGFRGLNLSIDFTGGTVIEVHYPHVADVHNIRAALEGDKYRDVTLQNFGSAQDIKLRLRLQKGESSTQ